MIFTTKNKMRRKHTAVATFQWQRQQVSQIGDGGQGLDTAETESSKWLKMHVSLESIQRKSVN